MVATHIVRRAAQLVYLAVTASEVLFYRSVFIAIEALALWAISTSLLISVLLISRSTRSILNVVIIQQSVCFGARRIGWVQVE